MNKLNLKNVTLFCYENRVENIEKAIEAVEICKYYADFGSIKFVTNNKIDYEHCIIDNFQINTLFDYSKFILTRLNSYIDKEFALTVHWDGFITNPKSFDEKLFTIDYCGAPWYNMNKQVGNGGFSWRSKKLLNLIDAAIKYYGYPSSQINNPHEDIVICFNLKTYLENNGCNFASFEIADKFSVETKGKWSGEFGFHNYKFVNPLNYGWENPLDRTT